MFRICVRGNDDFIVFPLLRQFQSDSMCFFRCDIFLRMEGLHEMKIHFLIALVVLQLGADELCVANFRLTVDAGDQLSTFEFGFLLLFYIVQHDG